MNTLDSPNKMICVLIISIVLIFSIKTEAVESNQECKWVSVDQNDIAEILTMIGERVKGNYNKISTWQGKVKIVSDGLYEGERGKRFFEVILHDRPLPNIINEHQEFTREFALDVNKELLYDNYYPDIQKYLIMDLDTGRELQLKENLRLGSSKAILTRDYHLDCMENKNRDGVTVSRTVIKQTRPQGKVGRQNQLHPVFDPRETMRIFGDVTGKSLDPLGGSFAKYLAFFDKEGGRSIDGYPTITVKECNVGDFKKYRIGLIVLSKDSTGATVHLFFNLVCSIKAGFNIVSYTTTDSNDRMFENKTWDYGLINGVYIPVKHIKQSFDYLTGDLKDQSTLTFIEQKVNDPIPAEVFTYKNLALQNGDKFIDNILNKEYIYQDEVLIEAEKNSK